MLPARMLPTPPASDDGLTHAVRDHIPESQSEVALDARRLARGSVPSLAPGLEVDIEIDIDIDIDGTVGVRVPVVAKHTSSNTGAIVATSLYYTSFLVIAATVSVVGVRMWRDAHRRPAAPPAAVALVGGDRVEIDADRLSVRRVGRTEWVAAQRLDEIAITGSLLVGSADDAIVALDVASGLERFAWSPPAGESWAVQRPVVLGACLFAVTTRGGDSIARCLDPGNGVPHWTAEIAGGRDCVAPVRAVHGAYIMQCPGWTTIIDDRDGAVSFDAGGVGLVRLEPPALLRFDARLTVAPWSDAERRFTRDGEVVQDGDDAAVSAVMYHDRLVMRPPSASNKLAIISRGSETTAIPATEYRLADDAPLVDDCGAGTSPRFQLVELAPPAGRTFDPSLAQRRVLALVDVERGVVASTTREITTPRHEQSPICRAGHYFVPLELREAGDTIVSALWIIDAETGTTLAVAAFDSETDASFTGLTADQIGDEDVVVIGRTGVQRLRWRDGDLQRARGLHDARRALLPVGALL